MYSFCSKHFDYSRQYFDTAESALYNAELGEGIDKSESQRSIKYIKTHPSFVISNNPISPCLILSRTRKVTALWTGRRC